ncbi:MAG: hypothetical protein ACLSAF_04435 [Intestinimonas sp.]
MEEWTGEHELASALEVDAELPDENLLTVEEVAGLDLLEPYGAGNPKPVFSLSGCTVSSLAEVGGGRHLKLRLSRGGHLLDAIFFSVGAAETGVAPGDRIDVTFTPQINEFRGNRSVQLNCATCAPRPPGWRRSRPSMSGCAGGGPFCPGGGGTHPQPGRIHGGVAVSQRPRPPGPGGGHRAPPGPGRLQDLWHQGDRDADHGMPGGAGRARPHPGGADHRPSAHRPVPGGGQRWTWSPPT